MLPKHAHCLLQGAVGIKGARSAAGFWGDAFHTY
jgi:hypothetical protein